MKHYALLGEHLGHSLSVPIHEAIFRLMDIRADYRLIEIPRADFAREAASVTSRLDGFNITIPYKKEIIPLLDRLDPVAQSIGAVNTVLTGEVSTGYNTDAAGFSAMLRHCGIDPAGRPCYVLGNGGASLAVIYALRAMGAASVQVVSRTPGDGLIGYDQLQDCFSGILVNCTPAGMWPDSEGCPIAPGRLDALLRRADGVADLIYNPPETVLTGRARALGIPACTGLYMLAAQAVEAESHWQGRPLPDDLTDRVIKELSGI